MKNVYITRLSKFLPNRPVSNDEMERYLGMINGRPSKARRLVLGKNKITCRYYAIDEKGNATHSNAQMTALAVKGLFVNGLTPDVLQVLSCGTTSPDHLLPSHAAMVHGFLNTKNIEIASFAGSCCSGMQALKYGFFSVLSGNSGNAACCGSERISSWMRSENYHNGANEDLSKINSNSYIAFEKEFLRWMLSDGAGAALLQDEPTEEINLKIEWVDITSFAGEIETCMYAGGEKLEDGSVKGWHEYEPLEWKEKSMFSLHQDVKLLSNCIVRFGQDFLKEISERRGFDIRTVDYFLPHLSSEFFRDQIMNTLDNAGMHVPQEKWFTNLTRVGNVGAASPYLMLEELFHSGRLKKGEKILLMVPESARFSYAYCLLTVC